MDKFTRKLENLLSPRRPSHVPDRPIQQSPSTGSNRPIQRSPSSGSNRPVQQSPSIGSNRPNTRLSILREEPEEPAISRHDVLPQSPEPVISRQGDVVISTSEAQGIFGLGDDPLEVEQKEEDHACMRLPRTWHTTDVLSVFKGMKGVHETWISANELHLRGPKAGHALSKLVLALRVLDALGVPNEEAVLDVLRVAPALMVDALPPGVEFTVRKGRPRLGGDVQWLQCVILSLTNRAPFLACRVFLSMEPQARWMLLTTCPSTVDTLWRHIEEEVDQESVRAFFQARLMSEMKKQEAGDPQSMAVWMARCPSWSEVSLHHIWQEHGSDRMKQFWLASCPALKEIVEQWTKSYASAPTLPRDDLGLPLKPDPEAWLDRYQPDEILHVLRVSKSLREGGLTWRAGVRYIRSQVLEILCSTRSHEVRHWDRLYGNAVEACNCLRTENQANLFFHCVLYVLSRKLDEADREAREWLLLRLSKNYRGYFCTVASDSFDFLVSHPHTDQLHLRWDKERFVGMAFAEEEGARFILSRMIALCGAEHGFQWGLGLKKEVKQRLIELADSQSASCLDWLAPDGLTTALWKVQFLWCPEWLIDSGKSLEDDEDTSGFTSLILANAIKQASRDKDDGEIPDKDLSELARYIAGQTPPAWIQLLLEKDSSNEKLRRLVICLVVKCASDAYRIEDDARATKLIALLCRSTVATSDDLDWAVATYMKSATALTQAAITQLQNALLKVEDMRGWERVFLWAASLLSSVQPDQRIGAAETMAYLARLFERRRPEYLKDEDLARVTTLLKPYSSQEKRRQK